MIFSYQVQQLLKHGQISLELGFSRLKVVLVIICLSLSLTFPSLGMAKKASIAIDLNSAELIRFDEPVSEIFVANPDIADVQLSNASAAYVFGKKIGVTTFFALNEKGKEILKLDVKITQDLARLRELIHMLDPDDLIEVHTVANSIIVTGVVSDAKTSDNILKVAEQFIGSEKKVINQMAIKAPVQVNLKVKIAEINRNALNTLGVNWQSAIKAGSFNFGVLTGTAPFTNPGNLNLTTNVINLAPPPVTGIQSALTSRLGAGFTNAKTNINAAIDMLAQDGLVTILAEPNLVSVSGETASFLAGGEFPYPVPQDQNNTTIDFKQFGVSLSFTPTILSGNLISMRVRPEVSDLDYTKGISLNSVQVPGIVTRNAETTVELASGQTFAIAGLLKDNVTSSVSGLQGLGEIPILGALFRSNSFQRGETELVILVTPYLVQPTSGRDMVSPLDDIRYASFVEQIFERKLTKENPRRGLEEPLGPGGVRFVGPAGYSFE